MAEKVITTVGTASNIETIFVNDGTDIKQATPDLLRESVGAAEDVSSLITKLVDSSVATCDTIRLTRIGNLVVLFGYITPVNVEANKTVEFVELGASIRPRSQVAVAVYASAASAPNTPKMMITSGKLTFRTPAAINSGRLILNAVWPV